MYVLITLQFQKVLPIYVLYVQIFIAHKIQCNLYYTLLSDHKNPVQCVLNYIMHSDDMQVIRNHVHLVHNPHRDMMHPRRDLCGRLCMYSRDRSRRT
jgi:hypothetical protein